MNNKYKPNVGDWCYAKNPQLVNLSRKFKIVKILSNSKWKAIDVEKHKETYIEFTEKGAGTSVNPSIHSQRWTTFKPLSMKGWKSLIEHMQHMEMRYRIISSCYLEEAEVLHAESLKLEEKLGLQK